ncbi:MAG: hypothetical protein HZB55_07265 [Deltaproteobacteria bacterium]|nr:hypothetical protein [Deltaproteobacteria bacterium]
MGLHIRLFGSMCVSLAAGEPPVPLGRTARSLLAFLLVHRHRLHARESLSGVFWGDASEERARSCLSTALWRLRQVLEPPGVARGSCLVTTPTGDVGFRRSPDHWLDVATFEEQVTRVTSRPFHAAEPDHARGLEEALALYVGDLLEGLYDDWALQERERLRSMHVESLVWLLRYHGYFGAYERAIGFGQEALRCEPTREEVHRELMRLHLEAGHRTLAARQYEACRRALDRYLGAEPADATRALYESAVRPAWSPVAGGPPATAGAGELVDHLSAAVRRFEEARGELQRVLELVSSAAANASPVPKRVN